MKNIFKDRKFEKKFLRDGYVVVPNLLSEKIIQSLLNVYEKHRHEYVTSFHTSHFSKNIAYKKDVHSAIAELVFAQAGKYLVNYTPLFGNFMIKTPDPKTSLDIHTDWTYVDENNFTSMAIWSPLVDTSFENGCLGIVEGSHKITNKIRGPLIQESTRNFNELWASKYGKLLPMKAGDAVFYHHGLLHFSPPNKTNQVRPALNLTVVPEQANCIHFCKPEGSEEIELYRVDGFMFYINYNHFQRPETKSLINKYPTDIVKYIDPHMKKYFIKKWCRDLIDSFSFN